MALTHKCNFKNILIPSGYKIRMKSRYERGLLLYVKDENSLYLGMGPDEEPIKITDPERDLEINMGDFGDDESNLLDSDVVVNCGSF